MTIPHHKFPDTIELYNLGDIHRGDHACDVRMYLKVVDHIASNPVAYWVSTGDVMNVALKTSKSCTYLSDNPGQELEDLSQEIVSIAGKCLGLVKSNHHNRFDTAVGMSLDKLLCRFLGIPFLGATGRLAVTCGRVSYWICMHHTTGGGATMGAKANKQERLRSGRPDYDLYLTGHTHTAMCTERVQEYVDRKRLRITKINQKLVTTGHFLDYDLSYADDMMLPEMPKGASRIVLHGHQVGQQINKKIEVDLFDGSNT